MRSSFLPKSLPKITDVSALEGYNKVLDKNLCNFGWDFGWNDDLINSFWI